MGAALGGFGYTLLLIVGTSLVERALLEACCRAAEQPFWRLLRDNRLGIRLGELHPALKACAPADCLPAAWRRRSKRSRMRSSA